MLNDSNLIICPRCGDVNAPKAVLCSICGTRLPEKNEASEPAPLIAEATVLDTVAQTPPTEEVHEDTAREIDARRAYHLLERAFVLADRHEFEAAVLACRQSLALVANYPLCSAVLGLLLKRHGDAQGSASAYAKADELAPEHEWSQLSLDDLHKIFVASDAPLPVSEAKAPAVAAPPTKTDVVAQVPAANKTENAAPALLNPALAVQPMPTPAQQTVSPPRGKNWMALVAIGAAILVVFLLIFKSLTPPAPTVREVQTVPNGGNVTIVEGSSTQLPPAGNTEPTSSPSNVQLQPSGSSDGSSAPPMPPAGQQPVNSGLNNRPTVGQAASPPVVVVRPTQAPAAAPVTNVAPTGEVTRNNELPPPAIPPVTQVPAQPAASGAQTTGGESSGNSGSEVSAPIAPSSQGNKRPGTPRNSIPGAFQPGRP